MGAEKPATCETSLAHVGHFQCFVTCWAWLLAEPSCPPGSGSSSFLMQTLQNWWSHGRMLVSETIVIRKGLGFFFSSFLARLMETGERRGETYMQSHNLIWHSLHIFGFVGSNAGSVVTPCDLSLALMEMTSLKSPPSTRLSTCSSTTKKGMLASTYSDASMGGGGETMCVTSSQLAGSRIWTLTSRAAAVFQMRAGFGS